uniref:Uncharacterized protein n=1 Tax=Arundo donax TaxID=35708 RepID=A0A0A9HHY1_ARUDO
MLDILCTNKNRILKQTYISLPNMQLRVLASKKRKERKAKDIKTQRMQQALKNEGYSTTASAK